MDYHFFSSYYYNNFENSFIIVYLFVKGVIGYFLQCYRDIVNSAYCMDTKTTNSTRIRPGNYHVAENAWGETCN